MATLFRIITLLLCLTAALLSIGFSFQHPWATALYPWPEGRLSYIWTGSIFAAYAVPLGWLAWRGERRAAWPGYFSLALTALGLAWLFNEEMYRQQLPCLGHYAMVMLCLGIGFSLMTSAALFASEKEDPLLLPNWVRNRVFIPVICVELLATFLLLTVHPLVFPWPLKSATSVLIGLIFLGSGCYHCFVLFRREWQYAKGQLLGFIGYGAVLIWPYFKHFWNVKPSHKPRTRPDSILRIEI